MRSPTFQRTSLLLLLLLSALLNVYNIVTVHQEDQDDGSLAGMRYRRRALGGEAGLFDEEDLDGAEAARAFPVASLVDRLSTVNAGGDHAHLSWKSEVVLERFDNVEYLDEPSVFGRGTRLVRINGAKYVWSMADNAIFTPDPEHPEYVGELVHGILVPFSTERNKMVTVNEDQYLLNTVNGTNALFTTDDDPTYVGRLNDGVITRPEVLDIGHAARVEAYETNLREENTQCAIPYPPDTEEALKLLSPSFPDTTYCRRKAAAAFATLQPAPRHASLKEWRSQSHVMLSMDCKSDPRCAPVVAVPHPPPATPGTRARTL